jgi:hypothetical protein
MKPRWRPIKNLYFRWGREVDLDAEAVALILERAGLIDLGIERTHYYETDKARAIPKDRYDMAVKDVLILAILENKGWDKCKP